MMEPEIRSSRREEAHSSFRENIRASSRRLLRVLGTGLALLPGLLFADGEKLATLKAGREIYTNVVVTSVTATDIYFSHSHGLGNAKLKNLEPELQKQFHYDAAKASQKEKQQIEAQALYTVELKKAKPPKRGSEPDDQPGPSTIQANALPARSFLNQPSPAIVGEKWLTDVPDMRGKFVLLDFWATWCVPCRRSIPELNALANKFKDRLVVVGLTDETEETVRKMTEPRIEYAIAIDTQHRSLTEVGVTAIPHALLVDPKGIVRFQGHPSYLDEEKLKNIIQQYSE
ncbi:MAG: cytochrome c biosis protein CcmG, thiol:disulfide interchange protein DsbE [Verrucomicrobiota bacterium]